MKTLLIALGMLSLSIVSSLAQDNDSNCEELADGVWKCALPTKPPAPPTCHVYGDNLICTAPVVIQAPVEKKSPTNCGWSNKRGRYVCW